MFVIFQWEQKCNPLGRHGLCGAYVPELQKHAGCPTALLYLRRCSVPNEKKIASLTLRFSSVRVIWVGDNPGFFKIQ
jgi:hypothetical protein